MQPANHGSVSKNLSNIVKSECPEVDWRGIIAFRNILVHGYLGVDIRRIWDVVENDLPVFEDKIKSILASMERT